MEAEYTASRFWSQKTLWVGLCDEGFSCELLNTHIQLSQSELTDHHTCLYFLSIFTLANKIKLSECFFMSKHTSWSFMLQTTHVSFRTNTHFSECVFVLLRPRRNQTAGVEPQRSRTFQPICKRVYMNCERLHSQSIIKCWWQDWSILHVSRKTEENCSCSCSNSGILRGNFHSSKVYNVSFLRLDENHWAPSGLISWDSECNSVSAGVLNLCRRRSLTSHSICFILLQV